MRAHSKNKFSLLFKQSREELQKNDEIMLALGTNPGVLRFVILNFGFVILVFREMVF
jgi:hypothetical protein